MPNFIFSPHRVLILHDYSLENIPLRIYILSAMTNLTTYFEWTFVRMSECLIWQHMYIYLDQILEEPSHEETVGNQDWWTAAADGWKQSKHVALLCDWDYRNPVGLPRDLPPQTVIMPTQWSMLLRPFGTIMLSLYQHDTIFCWLRVNSCPILNLLIK